MKKLLILLVITGLTLVAVISAFPLKNSQSENGYGYAPLEYGTLIERVNATGPIEPQGITLVTSAIPGQVVELAPGVDFNKEVKKNELLLKLDDRLAKLKKEQALVAIDTAVANTEAAKSQLTAATLALDFQQDLESKSIGQKKEKDRAEAQLKAAMANVKAAVAKEKEAGEALKQADLNLEQTEIRAPADGTILDRKVQVGQSVGPAAATPLFTMTKNPELLQVHAQVAEGDISKIKAGLDATFTVYAYPDPNEKFEGRVKEIRQIPTSVQGAVFYDTLIEVRNRRDTRTKEWMLRPGMTATVEIICRKHDKVWKMPSAALTFQLDPALQTEEDKEKLRRLESRTDKEQWKVVWIMGDHHKPRPFFVRTGGNSPAGESGITDGEWSEILEWDPEHKMPLDPSQPLAVIIKAPPAKKSGLFDKTGIKIS